MRKCLDITSVYEKASILLEHGSGFWNKTEYYKIWASIWGSLHFFCGYFHERDE